MKLPMPFGTEQVGEAEGHSFHVNRENTMKIRYLLRCSPWPLPSLRPIHSGPTRPSTEDKLLEVLKSGAAVGEKANACRELKLAGTEKSIPVLASLLTDAELSHPARFALESMPYPAAGAALRDALGKATGLARAGIIDSLGQRRDPLAVPLIAPDLAAKDLVLVAAAATALGKIGTPEAAALLTAARARRPGPRADQDRRRPAALRRSAARCRQERSRPLISTPCCRNRASRA